MLAVCCRLVVVRCYLVAVRCVPFVVRCLLPVGCSSLFDVR